MIDVAVVRDRLSAYHGTPVPRSVARFVAWLAEDPAHEALLEQRAYLLPAHDLAVADAAAPLPKRPTLRYHSEPPEFMAFARTGTDGEQIGVLELAPELARAPVEAFVGDAGSVGRQPPAGALERAVERARRLLRDGFPASAIVLARDVRSAAAGYDAIDEACAVWCDAALALGRPWHAAMVEEIAADDRRQRDEASTTTWSSTSISAITFNYEDP